MRRGSRVGVLPFGFLLFFPSWRQSRDQSNRQKKEKIKKIDWGKFRREMLGWGHFWRVVWALDGALFEFFPRKSYKFTFFILLEGDYFTKNCQNSSFHPFTEKITLRLGLGVELLAKKIFFRQTCSKTIFSWFWASFGKKFFFQNFKNFAVAPLG